MLIDWFTVCAQIVNFLVLVWLLKKFLYGRIIHAIDEREGKIKARLAEADTKEREANEQLAVYAVKLQEFEQARDAMLAEARLNAEKQHAEILEKARDDVHALETKWRDDLDRERQTFLLELRTRAATEVVAIARRVVADLACVEVQHCAVQVFLEKIRSLNGDTRRNLAKGDDLCIRSAFDLPEASQIRIQQTIEDLLETPVNLRFEPAPDMGLGVELRGNGWRVGWNSDSYLEAMEEELKETLEQGSQTGRTANAVA